MTEPKNYFTPLASFDQETQRLSDGKHFQKQHAQKISGLVSEITGILFRLGKCCLPKSTKTKFVWPEQNDLTRLDRLVEEVARLTRKRKLLVLWDYYQAVEGKFPKLKLLKRIQRLVDRAKTNTETRPMEVFAKMQVEGSQRPLAIKFLQLWIDLRRRKAEVAEVRWVEFSPLMMRFKTGKAYDAAVAEAMLTTKLGKTGPADLRAYTAFLEIECEDQAWLRRHHEGSRNFITWVIAGLQNPDLRRKLDRFCDPIDLEFLDEPLENLRDAAKRKRNALKLLKFRQKKSA